MTNMTELVNNIKQKLEAAGFSCINEDTSWSKSETQMMGGGTISINGQVMQQQGTLVKIEMLFDIAYEAVVKDVETETEERSLMCWFRVLQNEEAVQDLEINIYPDEFDFFCTLANKIFRI